MGRERDYGSEYERDKERYPEYIGGSSKLEKPEPQWMEFGKAVPPPPGYYDPEMIQREREKRLANNPFYLARLLRQKQQQSKSNQGNSSDTRTPTIHQPSKQGLGRRWFGDRARDQQPTKVATRPKKEEVQQPTPFNRTNKTETEPGSSGIVVNTQANVAVPGTRATYSYDFGNQIKPGEGVTYRWKVINDPATVAQLRQKGEYIPHHIDGGETTSSTFAGEEWSYTGQHTIEVNVYYHGKLIDSDRHTQVVRDASTLAREQFESSSQTGLQPDVYIGQLQLQRQIAQDNGATRKELKKIDRAINNAEKLLGVTEETSEVTAIPLKATLVPTADPTAVPLQLYLKPTKNGGWAIVDLTNPDPGAARTYEGKIKTGGRQADKVEGEAARKLAIDRAWDNYVRNNPHPEGELVADLAAGNKDGSSNIKQAKSDGVSELGKVRNWASRVGLVSGVAGIGLLLTPGAQGAGALLLGSAVAGGVAGGSGLLDRQKHGNLEWNTETFIDITDIAGGLAVGAGSAIRIGAKSATISQLGKNTVLISQGVETGTDVAAGTIISAAHYRRISEIRNSDLPEGEKKAQIDSELTLASATGGLILLGGVTYGKGNKGDFLDLSSGGFGTKKKAGANAIKVSPEDLKDLRSIGLDPDEAKLLQDANLSKADKDALIAKHQTAYADLNANFGEGNIKIFVERLGSKGLRQIYGASGNEGLRQVLDVLELEKQGKIRGVDDWVSFLNKGNRNNENIDNLVAELSETKRLSTDIDEGQVINIGGDAQVVPKKDGTTPTSYDITVENQSSEVSRNIDVTTVRDVIVDRGDIKEGIRHAVEKADAAPSGTIESTVRVDLPKEGHVASSGGERQKNFGRGGRYTITEPENTVTKTGGTARRTGADTFEGEEDLIEDIRDYLGNNNINNSESLDRLNLVDKSGSPLATFEKVNGRWSITDRNI